MPTIPLKNTFSMTNLYLKRETRRQAQANNNNKIYPKVWPKVFHSTYHNKVKTPAKTGVRVFFSSMS
jgi:hypothetical protein